MKFDKGNKVVFVAEIDDTRSFEYDECYYNIAIVGAGKRAIEGTKIK